MASRACGDRLAGALPGRHAGDALVCRRTWEVAAAIALVWLIKLLISSCDQCHTVIRL